MEVRPWSERPGELEEPQDADAVIRLGDRGVLLSPDAMQAAAAASCTLALTALA